jgi:hypothetical protein
MLGLGTPEEVHQHSLLLLQVVVQEELVQEEQGLQEVLVAVEAMLQVVQDLEILHQHHHLKEIMEVQVLHLVSLEALAVVVVLVPLVKMEHDLEMEEMAVPVEQCQNGLHQ